MLVVLRRCRARSASTPCQPRATPGRHAARTLNHRRHHKTTVVTTTFLQPHNNKRRKNDNSNHSPAPSLSEPPILCALFWVIASRATLALPHPATPLAAASSDAPIQIHIACCFRPLIAFQVVRRQMLAGPRCSAACGAAGVTRSASSGCSRTATQLVESFRSFTT